jgi:hypothetical protein
MLRSPSALGCSAIAGLVGCALSNHFVPVGVQASWPTLSKYVSANSTPFEALVAASIPLVCVISPSR